MIKVTHRVAIYLRVSTLDQTTANQERELREVASLRPFQGRRKVYIIAGAEALTAQAADALLKTLEEPQPQLTLVLTAAEEEALPATVVSRCRTISLQPVDTQTIVQLLIEHGQNEAMAAKLARLSRGSAGWALRAAGQPKIAAQQEETLARLSEVLDLDLDARLRLVETITGDKKDRTAVRRSVELLTLLARDILLLSQDLTPRLASGKELDVLSRQATRVTLDQIHAYLRGLKTAMERIDQNVDPRLALEALMVSLP